VHRIFARPLAKSAQGIGGRVGAPLPRLPVSCPFDARRVRLGSFPGNMLRHGGRCCALRRRRSALRWCSRGRGSDLLRLGSRGRRAVGAARRGSCRRLVSHIIRSANELRSLPVFTTGGRAGPSDHWINSGALQAALLSERVCSPDPLSLPVTNGERRSTLRDSGHSQQASAQSCGTAGSAPRLQRRP